MITTTLKMKTISAADALTADKLSEEWIAEQFRNVNDTKFKIISIQAYASGTWHNRTIIYRIIDDLKNEHNENEHNENDK
jgi:hypothetical protein